MLANPSAQSTHSFFASQTLHSKIRDDMYQVPPTAFSSLRNSILAHLERHSSNPAAESKPVVTRLCLALSALAVQMQWDAIIPDLLSNDPTKQGGTLPPQLKLELFKLIPEEANSPRLYLQSEQVRTRMCPLFTDRDCDLPLSPPPAHPPLPPGPLRVQPEPVTERGRNSRLYPPDRHCYPADAASAGDVLELPADVDQARPRPLIPLDQPPHLVQPRLQHRHGVAAVL